MTTIDLISGISVIILLICIVCFLVYLFMYKREYFNKLFDMEYIMCPKHCIFPIPGIVYDLDNCSAKDDNLGIHDYFLKLVKSRLEILEYLFPNCENKYFNDNINKYKWIINGSISDMNRLIVDNDSRGGKTFMGLNDLFSKNDNVNEVKNEEKNQNNIKEQELKDEKEVKAKEQDFLNFNVSLEDMNSIDTAVLMCDAVLEFINEKYLLEVNYNYMLALCLNVKIFFETIKYILVYTKSRL